jgi:uncharacterized membrane protein (UPF0127 family)
MRLFRLLIVFAVILVVTLSVVLVLVYVSDQGTGDLLLSGFGVSKIKITSETNSSDDFSGFVYVASTALEQEQGFQNVTSFGNCNGYSNHSLKCVGMIFVFSKTDDQCFWMHDTKIPLKQAWIASNMTVADVYDAHPETDYTVCHEALWVLETSLSTSLSVGDVIALSQA